MKRDRRFSGVLHLLLHLAEAPGPVTSETMAGAMRTNPVVVRRTLAGLRRDGLVRSEKGHGGGWTLARAPEAITLRDVYEAVGAPALLALTHRSETPGCPVEQAVNGALDGSFRAAETLLLERFAAVTLAEVGAGARAHRGGAGGCPAGSVPGHPSGARVRGRDSGPDPESVPSPSSRSTSPPEPSHPPKSESRPPSAATSG